MPSGRYQAAYTGPDLALHKGVSTFETLLDARGWLMAERHRMDAGIWVAPNRRNEQATDATTLAGYSQLWLSDRELKPRTRDLYRRLLDQKILPGLGERLLVDISPAVVRQWYGTLDPALPTRRAHAYGLLRTILTTAVNEDLIPVNPCRIRAAGNSKRVHKIKPASLAELEAIVQALPDRYGALVLLASWCALRFGELVELRRKDIDLAAGRIMVRRGVVVLDSKPVIGTPKSNAGMRDVSIPPHLVPVLKSHLDRFAAPGKEGLVFPAAEDSSRHMAHGTLFKTWDVARTAAGRPDLRFHDLRHTGAVLAAATGATLAELMNRLGHSTVGAAMRYQHAAGDRDLEIARRLSEMAQGLPEVSR